MASDSILFKENDSSGNTIWDPQRWASSYCRSLQNMAPLLRRLQAWGSCLHRPQQPPSFYEYEEFELPTSPLGPRALLIPFPNCYHQGKANVAADALSQISQRNQNEKDELRAENGQILHRLQNLLTNPSLASLSLFAPLHLHQVLICGTYVLP